MKHLAFFSFLAFLLFNLGSLSVFGQVVETEIIHRPWKETRTAHLNIYSCGPQQDVNKVAARLEQFRDAYASLAGGQAVASPPIVVMAFPDHETMKPFLPLYKGQAANLAGFFQRDPEENLIVLEMDDSLEVIFHEYTHLLLRRNDRIWPIWLKEGMAEMYSTFEASGRGVRIGKPIPHHLHTLINSPLIPVRDLMAVAHDSPDYNESTRQGRFYAESWLLTHYLMNGDNPVIKARFGRFTTLLNAGQTPEQAFTNALGLSYTAIDRELKRYLEKGQFESIAIITPTDLSAARSISVRVVGAGEASYRLGNELMRIGRDEDAKAYFAETMALIPASPLAYEGMGLLAHEPRQAAIFLKDAMTRGSINYLVWYTYAHVRMETAGDAHGRYTRIGKDLAADIRAADEHAITLMPTFANAHELLGFLLMVQDEELPLAEQHLQRAIALDPQNVAWLLSLSQLQLMTKDIDGARRTLAPLLNPNTDPKLRAKAEEIEAEIDRLSGRKNS